jgi:GntR family transcriptional regulator/MocR family aminotransferase
VLWPRQRVAEQAVIKTAAERGVGVHGVSPYCVKRPSRTGILLGYSSMREKEIQEGLRRLGEVL